MEKKNGETLRARLNPKTDMDIIEDLLKCEDRTARIKELYRKGMMVESLPKPRGIVLRVTADGKVLYEG